MPNVLTAYGSPAALTITCTSLASGSARESLAVSNTSDKFLDVLIQAKFKGTNSGTVAGAAAMTLYAAASADGGSDWPDTVTGADAAITLNSPNNLKLLGTVNFAVNNVQYHGGPWSLAQLYGGRMPEKWSIVVVNNVGFALSGTSTDHVVEWQGIFATVA